MTSDEFAVGMGYLTAGIGREFSQEQCAVWFDCLRDLTAAQFQHAVRRWLSESDSGFPSIAAIRQYAVEATNGQRLTAPEAWSRVLAAVRKFGHYQAAEADKVFDDVTRRALRGIGGFLTVCDSEEISILSGQFRRAYESLSERAEQHARLPEALRPRISIGPPDPKRLPVVEQLAETMRIEGTNT